VLLTVEEGSIGGFGSHVLHYLAEARLLEGGLKIHPMVLPDVFIDQGHPDQMYELAGLNASSIAKAALAALGVASRAPYRYPPTLLAETLRHSRP
jgi:1-deoxy-D-xylulose-5-phosphate synthase